MDSDDPADDDRTAADRDAVPQWAGTGYGDGPGDHAPGGPPRPRGIQWRVARSAALVFLGVALAVGAALFLVRSSEPSAAAVSVQLDAGPTSPTDSGPAPASEEPGPGSAEGGPGGAGPNAAGEDPGPAEDSSSDGTAPQGGRPRPAAASGAVAGQAPVTVYVTGAVAAPGVVTIAAGTRLVDVIGRAGGALPEADLEGINLAGIPADGQHIHVPAVGEAARPADAAPPPPVAQGSGAGTDGVTRSDGATGSAGGGAAPPGIIDINTATLAEIESLPRVGPVLGQRIIDWRDEHGPFAQPTDVDAVPGIGPSLLEGILPLIVVR